MGQKKWLVKIVRSKKICTPKNQCLILIYLKRILVDSTLSEYFSHHGCKIIGKYKGGRYVYSRLAIERCMDLFVVMFKLEDGWVGQNLS